MSSTNGWDRDGQQMDKGPGSALKVIVKWIIWIMVAGALLGLLGSALGWFGEAADVAKEELGPRAALGKYEWFITRHQDIQKMDLDIENFQRRFDSIADDYEGYGEDMTQWPLHVQSEYNRQRSMRRDDLVAVISQRNGLVAEYNAQSEKFNWALFNTKDDLPPPVLEVLPLP